MTFEFYHPKYYKKIKQDSRRVSFNPSKNDVSEVNRTSNYGDVKVENVDKSLLNFSTIHNSTKGINND